MTKSDALLEEVRAGVQVLDLAQPLANGMPCSPNHPGFRMSLARRHGDMVRPDGSSSANEVIVTGGHVGTHIDALAHASHEGRLYGGVDCMAAQTGGAFSELGVDTITPMICPGVFLDIAALHGTDCLPAAYEITADDLAGAAKAAGVAVAPGSVCLIRTGWSKLWSDPEAYVGQRTGVPGVGEGAARWLVEREVIAAGSDTTAFERVPPLRGHAVMPVHQILLVEHGIHIVEHMRFDELAGRGVAEFVFVLAPLKIVGGTGSPVRPLAVLGARG